MHPPSSPNDTPDVSANGDVVARYTSPISGRPDLSPTDQGPYNLYLSTCPPEAVYCYELQSTKLAQLISTYSARAVWRSRLSKLTAPTLAISDLESYHSAVKLLKTRPTLPPGWILPNKHARRHHSDITTRVGGAEKDNMPLVLECAMTGKLCNELQKVEDSWDALSSSLATWEKIHLKNSYNLIMGERLLIHTIRGLRCGG